MRSTASIPALAAIARGGDSRCGDRLTCRVRTDLRRIEQRTVEIDTARRSLPEAALVDSVALVPPPSRGPCGIAWSTPR